MGIYKYIKPYMPKVFDKLFLNVVRLMGAFKTSPLVLVRNIKKFRKLKNKYKGKRCFILGNGPSLNAHDLDLIKDEISFASNRVFYIFDKTEWRPTFYCLQDLNILRETGELCLKAIEVSEATFFRATSYNVLKDWNWNLDKVDFIPIWERYNLDNSLPFALEAKSYLYDGWTVTYMAIQLAVHMGFTEIYLLGVDHSFPFKLNEKGEVEVVDKSIAAHFYETSKNNEGLDAHKRRTSNYAVVTKCYESAERTSRSSGKYRIFNATRGGKLEVFERVNLEDILVL